MSRSIACRATSRRNGSKLDRMMAPGVSSTISSTPVAVSSARMLRPSRPMMRPFRSSLGRSTTDTVVSMACSAALRWMASVMICCARTAAVSRASVSRRLTRLAASRRASPSICLSSSSRASSALRPATRCSSRCRSATSCSARAAAAAARCSCRGDRLFAGPQLLLEPVGCGEPIGQCAGLVGERLLRGRRFPGGARAPASRPRPRARGPSRAPRAPLPSEASRRRARPA